MKSSSLISWSLAVGLAVLGACGDDDEDGNGTDAPDPAPDLDAAAREEQIERGTELYSDNCSSCHGLEGQGSDLAPPLVGPDALPRLPRPGQERDELFVTARDVYEFARENMPLNAPGSLEDEEYLDIVAFDLNANGFVWTGALDEADLEDIVINDEPQVP